MGPYPKTACAFLLKRHERQPRRIEKSPSTRLRIPRFSKRHNRSLGSRQSSAVAADRASHPACYAERKCEESPMLKIFIVLLSVFIFQASVHAADKIRIAYSAGTSSLLFLLAHKKGFLKAEGVDAEVIRMTGNVPVAALVSGEIDYHTALGTSVRGAIQGPPS